MIWVQTLTLPCTSCVTFGFTISLPLFVCLWLATSLTFWYSPCVQPFSLHMGLLLMNRMWRSDGMPLLRLGYTEAETSVLLSSLFSFACSEGSQLPCWEIPCDEWGRTWLSPAMAVAPADTLKVTLWEPLRKRLPAKMYWIPDPQNCEIVNVCCFKQLYVLVICHAAIAKCYCYDK